MALLTCPHSCMYPYLVLLLSRLSSFFISDCCIVFPSPDPFLHSCSATLTSYSEPADRSAKHGEGTRASSLKLWHSQRATLDSGLYRLDENMAASTHSLNKIPEPSSSHHSSHPTPLYLMPRPNSVAGKPGPQALFLLSLFMLSFQCF